MSHAVVTVRVRVERRPHGTAGPPLRRAHALAWRGKPKKNRSEGSVDLLCGDAPTGLKPAPSPARVITASRTRLRELEHVVK